MKSSKILILCLFLVPLLNLPVPANLQEGPKEGEVPLQAEVERVEIPDTERRVLKSSFVDEEFKIHVALPRGYSEEKGRYPVIYLLDSEYSFGCVAMS